MRRISFGIILMLLALLCSCCICALAEEELPAYAGKMTREDTFDEQANSFTDQLENGTFYVYNADRPEWKNLNNWYWIYNIGLASGEPITRLDFVQLSGPTDMKAFRFAKRDSQIEMSMGKMSRSAAGVYRFLMTAEGETCYARKTFTLELREQPKDLAPLEVRPLMILNNLDPVKDPVKNALISAPEEATAYLEIRDPKSRWYTSYHEEGEGGGKGPDFVLKWEDGHTVFRPLSEGTFQAQVSGWLGSVLAQEVKFDLIVSSTLTYDDFALTLTPETLQAAGGQRVKIGAAFADPDEVNKKAKNDGIRWTVTTADGGDASAFAKVVKGTLTIDKKLDSAQDLVVTAQSEKVPEKSSSVTIHAVPLTAQLTVEADTDTLSLKEGANQVQLSVKAEPADAIPAVTFKSSNEKIATVDENGLVTALAAGNVTITATAGDGSRKNASVKLKVLAADAE